MMRLVSEKMAQRLTGSSGGGGVAMAEEGDEKIEEKILIQELDVTIEMLFLYTTWIKQSFREKSDLTDSDGG